MWEMKTNQIDLNWIELNWIVMLQHWCHMKVKFILTWNAVIQNGCWHQPHVVVLSHRWVVSINFEKFHYLWWRKIFHIGSNCGIRYWFVVRWDTQPANRLWLYVWFKVRSPDFWFQSIYISISQVYPNQINRFFVFCFFVCFFFCRHWNFLTIVKRVSLYCTL